MKNATTMIVRNLMAGASLIAALSACTKSRPADINDDETKAQIFAISDLQGQQYNIQTGAALQSMSDLQNEPHALAEKPQVAIKSSNAPDRLQNIFESLPISAQSGQAYPVRLSVDAKAVTLLRIVSNVNDLTDVEKGSMIQQTVTVNKTPQQMNLVPMAQIVVKDYGTLCRIKNDNGENTANLKICHTDFSKATHVQISLKGDDLQAALGDHQLDQVFLKDRLNGKITTLSALQQQMKFSLYPITDDKVVTYVSTDTGSQVNLLIYKIAKKSQITDDKILQQLKSNLKLGQVVQCPTEVLSTLAVADQADCVLMLAYNIKGDAVRAETQTTDDLGRPGIKVDLKKTASTSSSLLQFDEAVPATVVNPSDLTQLNPYNTVRISDIMNKEFMMRRTFEDAASTLTGFGPGASGYMDLVKFELQDKALVVRRVLVINGARDATNVDKEEVMSIPVTYKKIDSATTSSVAPRLIDATKADAQYAFLDWTANTIGATNSPLSYASDGPEMCFKSTSRQDVTDLDNRIQDGVLSFSISGSYTFEPSCITFNSLNDYWYGGGMQSNFNIKERISFMVNKGAQDANPGMSVAFNAQNVMGYGVFTMDQINPDQYGNRMGVIGTENAQPVIYDFSNGKQLVYHLGGLPDDQNSWVYKALVDGTKEVVADWNQSLHRAFVGTSLDRSGDFIVLKVDGVDDTVGHLGDLDRSYIWNFTKNMDSGLLGLSQAAPNPRSGRIEQNNVLMYSGNLIGELGYIRNSVRKQLAYRQMKAAALDALKKQANVQDAQNVNLPTSGDNGGLDVYTSENASMINKIMKNHLGSDPVILGQSQSRQSMLSHALNARSQLAIILPGNKSLLAKKNQYLSKTSDNLILEHIVQQAVAQKLTRDSNGLTALAAIELLKSTKNISAEQKQSLLNDARRLTLQSKFNKNFDKGPNCILSAEEFETAMGTDPDLLVEAKTVDIFKKWYKATLAHEMGHSLGLTHNFEGSVDKANFLFANETASDSSRNYSSIMDYVPDQYQRYGGPGPYDVRALRVAYTGMIEISPTLQSLVKDGPSGKVLSSADGKTSIPLTKASDDFYYEIPLATYQKLALGNQTWWRMDTSTLKKFPLKNYMYCTDKDIGNDPLCNRWDMGTTEPEIVKYYAQQYKDSYATANTRGDDLMKIPSRQRYIGHMLMNFFGIRPFMEEGFYRAMFGSYSQDQISNAFSAGFEGYKFFVELLSAPTENLEYSSMDRFHLFQHPYELDNKDKDGKDITVKGTDNILVETKSMTDLLIPGSDFDVSTRGVEDDKSFALLMLTLQGIGGDRYDAHNLTLSYADFENYVMQMNSSASPLFSVMRGALSNTTPSYVFGEHGLAALPIDDYKIDVSDSNEFRYHLLTATAINLESSSLTDKGNYATLFRVSSSQNGTPKDRLAVASLDQSLTSPASVKYWAMDNANASKKMIDTAARNRRYIENAKAIGDDMLKLYQAAKTKDAAATTAATFSSAAFTGDPTVDLKNSMAANGVRASDVTSEANFDAQATKTLTDLMAINTDGALTSDEAVANLQAEYKAQTGKDATVEQAQKLLLSQDVNEALQYMASLDTLGTQLQQLTDDQLNSAAVQAQLSQIKKASSQIAQQNALIGVAEKAMINNKSLAVDSQGNVTAASDLGDMVAKIADDQALENQHGIIIQNLQVLNQLLVNMHPEMNRY